MQRIKYNDLIEWYTSKYRKPLVIWGARQVGKTYLVKELFAKNKDIFDDYVYIDLKKDNEANSFFKTTSNPKDYLNFIELKFNKKVSNKVLLVFDEVQQCSQVLFSLKYFEEDYPELPVIATGSMVRLSLKHNGDPTFLFPVGAINELNIYPMTFEEYLLNANIILLDKIKNAYLNKKPLESYEHEIALNYLFEFLIIGGLPEALNIYIENKSYIDANNAIKNIYNNYLADMDLYNVSNETI